MLLWTMFDRRLRPLCQHCSCQRMARTRLRIRSSRKEGHSCRRFRNQRRDRRFNYQRFHCCNRFGRCFSRLLLAKSPLGPTWNPGKACQRCLERALSNWGKDNSWFLLRQSQLQFIISWSLLPIDWWQNCVCVCSNCSVHLFWFTRMFSRRI